MVILTHRSPIQFCLQSNGSYEAVAAPGGVATALRQLFQLHASRAETVERMESVAAALGNDRAALALGARPPAGIHLLVFKETVPELYSSYLYLCNSVIWYGLHELYGEVTPPDVSARL